jgi:hypothetical protein
MVMSEPSTPYWPIWGKVASISPCESVGEASEKLPFCAASRAYIFRLIYEPFEGVMGKMTPKRPYRKLRLQLSDDDRQRVHALLRKGFMPARVLKRMSILNLLDKGKSALKVSQLLDVSPTTVRAVAQRYLQEGLEEALRDRFNC